jgi:hypothetical protein
MVQITFITGLRFIIDNLSHDAKRYASNIVTVTP